jgi:hypothetical protein
MIKITVTEEEILRMPNDFDLGEFIRLKYWNRKKFMALVSDDKEVKEVFDTEVNNVIPICSKDKCVICGNESPYPRKTHIDLRIGYVEGSGQGCFQPHVCNHN